LRVSSMVRSEGGGTELKNPSLLRDKCYVDGQWVGASSGAAFDVTNPATGDRITSVPSLDAAETEKAIAAASAALKDWSGRTAKVRSQILWKWYNLIIENKEDLAYLMTVEQGKPLAEARGEVQYGADFISWFAEEGRRVYGDTIPLNAANMRGMVMKQPVGVCAAITPWNFPNAMITRKAGAALAAGCTMVVKPAELTPLSALALAELAEQAGVPPGVLNVVTGAPATVGSVLAEHPTVSKLSFTGSTPTGQLLLKQCAGTVKRVSMELGGNAPFLVFPDCDLDAAVDGAMASKFRNAGQTCVCANRFLIHADVYNAFVAKLQARVAALRVGDGLAARVDQGPLINAAAVEKCERHVADAVAKGAKVVAGGGRHELGGTFFQPTILQNCTPDMTIFREETFGPVAPLFKFTSEKEALEMANDTPFGLASYVYTRDVGRVWRVSERLQYGMVGVNTGLVSSEVAPFGGVKQSGIGREGSKYGIEEYLETKYVCLGEM